MNFVVDVCVFSIHIPCQVPMKFLRSSYGDPTKFLQRYGPSYKVSAEIGALPTKFARSLDKVWRGSFLRSLFKIGIPKGQSKLPVDAIYFFAVEPLRPKVITPSPVITSL